MVGRYKLNQIYNEDSYKAIKNIPDNSIDLIIIDPPYQIDSTNGGKNSELAKSIQNMNQQLNHNINKVLNNKNDEKAETTNSTSNKFNVTLTSDALKSIEDNTVENIPSLRYSKYIKREKKGNITPENIDVIMLSQIPHISVDTAMQILDKYKTIYKLINILKENENELTGFMVKTKSGERKLNSNAITNIKNYLIVKQS